MKHFNQAEQATAQGVLRSDVFSGVHFGRLVRRYPIRQQ